MHTIVAATRAPRIIKKADVAAVETIIMSICPSGLVEGVTYGTTESAVESTEFVLIIIV